MAKEEVEQLFHQVLYKTEALQAVLEQTADWGNLGDGVDSLISEREELLTLLRELLQHESNLEQYRVYYERSRAVEASVKQKLTSLMSNLSNKIKEAQHSKQINKQYDAYLRLMPYGAFIDDKK